MKRKILAHQVADQLFAAEAAIDGALAAVASLTAMLPNARIDARISAMVGQTVFERTSETIAALATARRGIVETHRELSGVQAEIGLRHVALGGWTKPEDDVPRTGQLTAVDGGRTAA